MGSLVRKRPPGRTAPLMAHGCCDRLYLTASNRTSEAEATVRAHMSVM